MSFRFSEVGERHKKAFAATKNSHRPLVLAAAAGYGGAGFQLVRKFPTVRRMTYPNGGMTSVVLFLYVVHPLLGISLLCTLIFDLRPKITFARLPLSVLRVHENTAPRQKCTGVLVLCVCVPHAR